MRRNPFQSPNPMRRMLEKAAHVLLNQTIVPRCVEGDEQGLRLLAGQYARERYRTLLPPRETEDAGIHAHELRVYSQNGEDGILLHLFSEIGVSNRRFVEFGVEDGRQCNAANLAINFGWRGLLMDGDSSNVASARGFYEGALGKRAAEVRIVQAWVTRDNINELLREGGMAGDIDLLSIDVDGNDYWVWEAITCATPRVTVLEYNAAYGPERRVTVPYEAEFNFREKQREGFYFGASLAALAQLSSRKGYRLVGCDSWGVNAFFVREDVATPRLPALTAGQAFCPLRYRLEQGYTVERQYEMVRRLPVVEV